MKQVQFLTFTSALLFTTKGLFPNINLNGKQLIGGSVYQLNCTTSLGALGCSVEFHVNDTTVDDIRFLNGKCVHKDGECQSNKCYCSNDCKIFQLNMTSTTSNSKNNFGCGARIRVSESDTNITYSARTAIKQDGEEFRMSEKIIFPVSFEKICSSTTLAPPQGNGDCDSTLTTLFYVIVPTISIPFIIGGFIFIRKKERKSNNQIIKNLQKNEHDQACRSDSKASSSSGSSTDTSVSLYI